jgi:hypothetical protein
VGCLPPYYFRNAGRSGVIFPKRLFPPYEPAILSTHANGDLIHIYLIEALFGAHGTEARR